ncbi:MAG: hypothetical protein AAGH74_13430 [Pseudomonadota bacterium]
MIRTLLALRIWGIGALAAVSLTSEAAAITYDIFFSAPCVAASCSGRVTATGTMTVAGFNSITDPSQILNYDIKLSSNLTEPVRLTTANSVFSINSGTELAATPTALFFRHFLSTGQGATLEGGEPGALGGFQFFPATTSGLFMVINSATPAVQGSVRFPQSQRLDIGSPAEIPLPPTLPLLLGGLVAVVLTTRRRLS